MRVQSGRLILQSDLFASASLLIVPPLHHHTVVTVCASLSILSSAVRGNRHAGYSSHAFCDGAAGSRRWRIKPGVVLRRCCCQPSCWLIEPGVLRRCCRQASRSLVEPGVFCDGAAGSRHAGGSSPAFLATLLQAAVTLAGRARRVLRRCCTQASRWLVEPFVVRRCWRQPSRWLIEPRVLRRCCRQASRWLIEPGVLRRCCRQPSRWLFEPSVSRDAAAGSRHAG